MHDRLGTTGSCGNKSMTQAVFSRGLILAATRALLSTNSRKYLNNVTGVTPGFYRVTYTTFEICYNDVKISMKWTGYCYPAPKKCFRCGEISSRNIEKSFCKIEITLGTMEISLWCDEKSLCSMKISLRCIEISCGSNKKSCRSLEISLGSDDKAFCSPAISLGSDDKSLRSLLISLGSDEISGRGAVEFLPARYKTVNKKLKIKGGQNAL